MPRKKTLWFRFYVEAIHDRKLRRQPPASRWLWVVILAMARKSPIPGRLLLACEGSGYDAIDIDDLADAAALRTKEVRAGIAAFEELGMIETDPEDGCWVVTKWNERQFESDDVTKRTRKHRSEEQGRNVPKTVPDEADGTPSSRARATETETETETESNPLSTGVDEHELEEQFERFWDVWPKRNGKKIGKADALRKWKRLTLPERRAAYIGARNYAAACADPSITGVGAQDAFRWLEKRRWEDWQDPAVPEHAQASTPGGDLFR